MTWHLDPVQLVARHYTGGRSFTAGDPFSAIVTINLLAPGLAWAFGASKDDGSKLTPGEFKELGHKLYAEYGVNTLMARRHNKVVTFDLKRYEEAH